jgi:hypothetical protein
MIETVIYEIEVAIRQFAAGAIKFEEVEIALQNIAAAHSVKYADVKSIFNKRVAISK